LTLLSPVGLENSLTQFVDPKIKKFIIRGVYDSDNKDYDGNYAYISIPSSQELFQLDGKVNGVEIRLNNITDSENEKEKIKASLGNDFKVMTWYDLHEDFYSILKVERWVAFIILSLIIAVASFNILGSLTMTVIEKKRDIGVLKALGATDKMITNIFLFEGSSSIRLNTALCTFSDSKQDSSISSMNRETSFILRFPKTYLVDAWLSIRYCFALVIAT